MKYGLLFLGLSAGALVWALLNGRPASSIVDQVYWQGTALLAAWIFCEVMK